MFPSYDPNKGKKQKGTETAETVEVPEEQPEEPDQQEQKEEVIIKKQDASVDEVPNQIVNDPFAQFKALTQEQIDHRGNVSDKRKAQIDKTQRMVEKLKEDMTANQIGLYNSSEDDEDDDHHMRELVPQERQFRSEAIFTVLNASARTSGAPTLYRTFPTSDVKNVKEESDYKYDPKRRSKKRKRSRSRRSRSRSNDRNRRDKKYIELSSDSSSSRSRSGSRNRRSKKYRRSPSPPPKPAIRQQKYGFVTDQEFNSMRSAATNLLVHDPKIDLDNWNLSIPKKAIPKTNFYVQNIEGIESSDMFKRNYSQELSDKAKKPIREKKFHEELLRIAKDQPTESVYAGILIDIPGSEFSRTGFWRIVQTPYAFKRKDENAAVTSVRNDFVRYNQEASDGTMRNIADLEMKSQSLNQSLRATPGRIDLWEEFIKLQDTIYNARERHGISGSRNDHLDRKRAILFDAIRKNQTHYVFQLMDIELMIEQGRSAEEVIDSLKKITFKFPHQPSVWLRYLDYLQYNIQVFSYERMRSAFLECMDKVRGLVEGTLLSHAKLINDIPAFRQFQLDVYIRYLKWLIDCGAVPLALANIQATFELNFGLNSRIHTARNHNERIAILREFWDSKMPRIGDPDGNGADNTNLSANRGRSAKEREMGEYDVSLVNIHDALNKIVRADQPPKISWVQFERAMLNLDARVKRTTLDINTCNEEWMNDILELNLHVEVSSKDLVVYWHPTDEVDLDFTQPLLEVLGITFASSNGCFSTTGNLVNEWITTGVATTEKNVFHEIPSYSEPTMRAIGMHIVNYLVNNDGHGKVSKERKFKLMVASFLTRAAVFKKQHNLFSISSNKLMQLYNEATLPFESVLSSDETLTKAFRLVMVEKFIEFWRTGKVNLDEMITTNERCEKQERELPYNYVETDKSKMGTKIPVCLSEILKLSYAFNKKSSRKFNLGKSDISTVQFNLYSLLLMAEILSCDQKSLFHLLVTELLGRYPENEKEDRKSLITSLIELKTALEQKENSFGQFRVSPDTCYLPRASTIVHCLILLSYSVETSEAYETIFNIRNVCIGVQERCAHLNTHNEYDIRDSKRLIQTMLNFLYFENRKMPNLKDYKILVETANAFFPLDSNYAKLFVDLYSTSTQKQIMLEVRKINTEREYILQSKTNYYNLLHERRLLMLGISNLYCAIKVSLNHEFPSHRALFEKCRDIASQLRDPTIWRLVMKLARNVNDSNKSLDEAFILARGQCGWNRNLHIDYCDYKQDAKVDIVITDLLDIMKGFIDGRQGLHVAFIDDIALIAEYAKIAKIEKEKETLANNATFQT